jgi:hypothetical protein
MRNSNPELIVNRDPSRPRKPKTVEDQFPIRFQNVAELSQQPSSKMISKLPGRITDDRIKHFHSKRQMIHRRSNSFLPRLTPVQGLDLSLLEKSLQQIHSDISNRALSTANVQGKPLTEIPNLLLNRTGPAPSLLESVTWILPIYQSSISSIQQE